MQEELASDIELVTEDKVGGNIFEDAFDRAKTIVTGRVEPSPSVRRYLEKNGVIQITSLFVVRAPVQKAIQYIANVISFGKYEQTKKKLDYDDVFHLGLCFVLSDSKTGIIEKNHVIRIGKVNNCNYQFMQVSIPVGSFFNLINLIENAIPLYSSAKEFYSYNAKTNNCQRFIYSLLKGSNLITESLEKFIVQDAVSLIENSKLPENILNLGTTLAEKLDILFYGRGLQSILIPRKNFNLDEAIKWIQDHNYKNQKIHKTYNYWRFRQKRPQKKDKYYTKTIRPSGIKFVISYS